MTRIEPVLTNDAPKPLGHYSQAVRAGGFIHVSGQLPIKAEGQSEQSNDPFDEQARLVLRNLLAVLDAAGAAPSHVGVGSGWGRNDTLSISSLSLHDICDSILADGEITGDPAIASAFSNQCHDLGCEPI